MNPRLTRCLALCALALAVCIGIGAALVLSKNRQREAEAAAAAASGFPPLATMPININSDAPASTVRESTNGTHSGKP